MTNLLIVIGIQIVFCILAVIWLRYRLARFFSDSSTVDSVRQEVNSLLMELDASAERNINIMEDRLQQLRQLLAESDKRLSLLTQESRNRQKENDVYSRLGRLPQPVRVPEQPAGAMAESRSLPAAVPATESPYAFDRRSEPKAAQNPNEPVPFVKLGGTQTSATLSFVDQVLDLYKQGFTAAVIANKTGATAAEVDIVITMEQMRQGGEAR